jgi:hypothetical protein
VGGRAEVKHGQKTLCLFFKFEYPRRGIVGISVWIGLFQTISKSAIGISAHQKEEGKIDLSELHREKHPEQRNSE